MSGWLSGTPEYKQKSQEDRRLALETRVIKRIWDFANIRPPSLKAATEECRLETGKEALNFDWFNDKYNFPATLVAAKIPWVHEVTVGDLAGPVKKLPFFKEYQQRLDEADVDPAEQGMALVFPWAHIPKGGSAMVLHNLTVDLWGDGDFWLDRGLTIVRPYNGVVYAIESLNDFLTGVGAGWAEQ